MSRHWGAISILWYDLLEYISLLSLRYLLAVDQKPFHVEYLDHYDRQKIPVEPTCLTVKQVFTITLYI